MFQKILGTISENSSKPEIGNYTAEKRLPNLFHSREKRPPKVFFQERAGFRNLFYAEPFVGEIGKGLANRLPAQTYTVLYTTTITTLAQLYEYTAWEALLTEQNVASQI